MNNKLHSFKKLLDGQNLHYDLFDRLVKVETFKKNTETGEWEKEVWVFEYDALDRRIAKYRDLSDGLKAEEREFVWDGSHLLQEVYSNGRYTYIYTDVDSYEPLAQIHNYTNAENETYQEINYFHCDQIGIPREMTDKDGNLLWFGEYDAWGKLTQETNVTGTAHQPFRLQNQYCDSEIRLHYNFFRYYDPDCGRFINQDPIGLWGDDNFYTFALNIQDWIDPLGLKKKSSSRKPKFVSTKSTGRTKPRNRLEAKIMDQIKKRPEKGKVIVPEDKIGDKCYAGKGWNKMEQKIDGVTVHYMAKFDPKGKMTHVTDFKFK